jgi:CubicO group peptidase (beta-lactamase class C family)
MPISQRACVARWLRAQSTRREAAVGVHRQSSEERPMAVPERFRRRGARGTSHVAGFVAPGFEPVRDVFVANFHERGEVGGAVCVVIDGDVVVDLWGGVRDPKSGAPWLADTMTLIHSTTKGLSALVLALMHTRGLLDYDERVTTYWPEFGQVGKQDITVRLLLAHQAGLFAFDEHVDGDVVADLDRLAGVMERQPPIWPPGERQAYHAITLGFYENELVRRIDPAGRTIGQVLHEDIAVPLGVGNEVYIGAPSALPDERLAALIPPGRLAQLTSLPIRLVIDAARPHSVLHRALIANPGTGFYVSPEHVIVRDLEVPSGGAIATARAIATVYGAFARPAGPLNVRPETIEELSAPPAPARRGYDDACLHGDARFSLGFMKPSDLMPFGSEVAFGAPGAGGSMGFADPALRLGYGYVTDRMGVALQGDPRDLALRRSLRSVVANGS